MADVLVVLVATALAWFLTDRWSRTLARTTPLRRRNYRGLEVATACGVAVIGGVVVAAAVLRAAAALFGGDLLDDTARAATAFVVATVGFGLLGLWDDIAGGDQARGWREHIASLRAGSPSSGAVKLVGGIVLAFSLVAGNGDFNNVVIATGVLAGSANLFNLLDLRPGRAAKFWLASALFIGIGLVVTRDTGTALTLLVAGAAVAAFLRHELAERAMLGDVGANAIGAPIGIAILTFANTTVSAVALAVLIALHALADRPGLSRLIAAVPPLRAFDRAGRAPSDVT